MWKTLERKRFSIVIPVYNVEAYLKQCVDSVLSQTFEDYECILVDDGSTDSSGAICDEYKNTDNRIIVIHKPNGGLSSARNAGLDICTGEYVFFLDSDDYLNTDEALNEMALITETSAPDMIIIPFTKYYEHSGRMIPQMPAELDFEKIRSTDWTVSTETLLKLCLYKASAGNKCVKTHIYSLHKMRFHDGKLCEDIPWCADLLRYCRTFDYCNNPFYVYRQRAGSISKGSSKAINDAFHFIADGYNLVQTLEEPEKHIIAAYYAYEYSWLIARQFECETITPKQVEALKGLLQYGLSSKTKKVKGLVDIFGFKIASRILQAFLLIRGKSMGER